MRRGPPWDTKTYAARSRARCFICDIAAGTPERPHHLVYEDEHSIAFLDAFPVTEGYVLVAPREHRERVTGDFSEAEYLAMQRTLYRVAEGVRQAYSPERLYILSLGSQAANSHVHWHVVPLPPGVPFEEQQLTFLSWEREGILDLPEDEMAAIARRIRAKLGV